MEVILLEKVHNLGNLGDKVQVAPGYARNYLVPQGKAKQATKNNLLEFEARRADLELAAEDSLIRSKALRDKLNGQSIVIVRKTGEEGKLFGSVNVSDIVKQAKETGVELEKRQIRLPQGPIRFTGNYEIDVSLHSDVVAKINLLVEAE